MVAGSEWRSSVAAWRRFLTCIYPHPTSLPPFLPFAVSGDQAFAPRPSFIARPVVGGVFAKMLV